LIHLFCASGNPGKLREFRLAAGLAPVAIELVPGFKQLPPCVEDGETFEANAILKARHYGQHAVGPIFADDSGLEVDALNGAPGVYSARYSGPNATDESNNRLLLEKLRGVTGRTARFVCAIALVDGGELRGVWRGAVEGAILHEPRGDSGFGYDPLFFCPQLGSTFGEAGAGEKFAVSHRGQALRAMLADLMPAKQRA
jgi:XTP/dITP diphosphohydrolase